MRHNRQTMVGKTVVLAGARHFLLTLVLLPLVFCSSPAEEVPEKEVEPVVDSETPAEPEGIPYAILDTDKGSITVKLRPDVAPETVKNFIDLAEVGFYRRTSFHRVIRDRLIQGGDPNSRDNNPYNDGQGGSGRTIKAEFSSMPFQRGTVAMARQPSFPDSASSQFFICLQRVPQWDGDYIIFGEVVEGIEVAQEISRVKTSEQPQLRERPTGKIYLKDVRIEYRQE
ncbi:MAG TPA: peptidylprolyl isomerase [Acidobacteriota bacterium]|nr:peptidylprolyl isomerase [Acidobacteriota bacterium]